jgi:putative ABC transport system substrate-binding protein
MRRRVFVSSVLALSMTRSVAALAASKPARIGWVTAQREASLVPFINSFREGLAQLGYSEGRDFQRKGAPARKRGPAPLSALSLP